VVVPPDFVGELRMTDFGFAKRHCRKFATTPRLKDSFFARLRAACSGLETVSKPAAD